jgi:hypothetical protein
MAVGDRVTGIDSALLARTDRVTSGSAALVLAQKGLAWKL